MSSGIKQIKNELQLYLASKQYQSYSFIESDSNYYDNCIRWRKDLLDAPHEGYLCKTMILENKQWKPSKNEDEQNYDRFYPQYICVVYQYISVLNAVRLGKIAREVQNKNMTLQFGSKAFNFRLADNEIQEQITGYIKNGVTPFNFKTKIPIYISSQLQKLSPQFFWVGGGHPNLKLRVSFEEFIQKSESDVFIADFTDPIPDIDFETFKAK